MGALINSVCYSSVSDAADAYFSSLPSSLVSGSTTYESHYTKTGGVWYLVTDEYSSALVLQSSSSVAAQVPSFSVCDPTQTFMDGLTLGWGVLAAMAAAFAVRAWRWGL